MSAPSPTVAQAYDAYPEPVRARLLRIRALIFSVAESSGVGPLTETLKWGEPAYLTEATKSGTTIRLGWSPRAPEQCGLYVHCQTNLVEGFRQDLPDAFTYDGTRAVLIPVTKDYPQDALAQIIARALTYHRRKRSAASGR